MVTQSFGFLGHYFLIEFELSKKVRGKNKKVWVTESFGFLVINKKSKVYFSLLKKLRGHSVIWFFGSLLPN